MYKSTHICRENASLAMFIRPAIIFILLCEGNTQAGVIFSKKVGGAFEDANSYTAFSRFQ